MYNIRVRYVTDVLYVGYWSIERLFSPASESHNAIFIEDCFQTQGVACDDNWHSMLMSTTIGTSCIDHLSDSSVDVGEVTGVHEPALSMQLGCASLAAAQDRLAVDTADGLSMQKRHAESRIRDFYHLITGKSK